MAGVQDALSRPSKLAAGRPWLRGTGGLAFWALQGLALILGVTLVSFVLMVHFGPDPSYALLGKHPTPDEIARLRDELGLDLPFWQRYAGFLSDLARLDFGRSAATGQRVGALLAETFPVTLALLAPGFLLGNLLAIVLGLVAAWYRGGWVDRWLMALSVVGMSISYLVVVIAFQLVFCVWLGWFPVRGWNTDTAGAYLQHVAVPTMAMVFVTLGYNTRFCRAVLVEQMHSDHVRTARAFGAGPVAILYRGVLRNALIPILTRVLFSVPLILVSGSLLLETQFGIPGLGKVSFDAIVSGDLPVLKAVVSLTAVLFVAVQMLAELLYRVVDPRIGAR